MRYQALILFTVLGALGGNALAHEDTIISVAPNGGALDVPDEYQPASLVVESRDAGVPSVELRLSGKVLDFPACVTELFVLPEIEELLVHGSWYHDFDLLPPYLSIDLPQESVVLGWYSGYSLLFNLETAELLEVVRYEFSEEGRNIRDSELIELNTLCSAGELEQLEPKSVR